MCERSWQDFALNGDHAGGARTTKERRDRIDRPTQGGNRNAGILTLAATLTTAPLWESRIASRHTIGDKRLNRHRHALFDECLTTTSRQTVGISISQSQE